MQPLEAVLQNGASYLRLSTAVLLHHTGSCCAMLGWAGLGWAGLGWAVLCCAVLCCAVLGCAMSNLQCQSHCSSEDAFVRVDYSAMCGADPWVDTLRRWKMEKRLSSSISRHMPLWHISVSMAVWHRHYCNLFGALLSHAFEQVVLSGCRLPTFIVC